MKRKERKMLKLKGRKEEFRRWEEKTEEILRQDDIDRAKQMDDSKKLKLEKGKKYSLSRDQVDLGYGLGMYLGTEGGFHFFKKLDCEENPISSDKDLYIVIEDYLAEQKKDGVIEVYHNFISMGMGFFWRENLDMEGSILSRYNSLASRIMNVAETSRNMVNRIQNSRIKERFVKVLNNFGSSGGKN